MKVKTNIKAQTVSAKIIKADGTIVDLGIIAQYKKQSIVRRFLNWLMSLN